MFFKVLLYANRKEYWGLLSLDGLLSGKLKILVQKDPHHTETWYWSMDQENTFQWYFRGFCFLADEKATQEMKDDGYALIRADL